MTDSASSAWDSISSTFTSETETIPGNVPGDTATDGNIFSDGMAELQQAMMEWLAENLPEDVAMSIFQTKTTQEGARELIDPPEWNETLQQAGDMLSGLMTAYSYYSWAKLLIDVAFQCDEEEFGVAGKMEQLACVDVGSTCLIRTVTGCQRRRNHQCCFNSMLARIVMEQAAEQLGRPLGRDEACRGMTMGELQDLDWSQIDLNEWIAMMFESGLMPDDFSDDALTGEGRMINQGARQTAAQRALLRLQGISKEDIDAMNEELRQPLDCSIYPRPPVCEYYN